MSKPHSSITKFPPGVGGLAAGAAALTAYNHYNQRPKPSYSYNQPIAYPGYNQPAYGGYHQPQYHIRPHYQQPFGTHSLGPVNPYNTNHIYGTHNLAQTPTNHYVNPNQVSKPNNHQQQDTTQGSNSGPIKAPVSIPTGQIYHSNPVAVSGWYPVQGKSTFSNVLTGGLGLAAGAAIANHLSKPSYGYRRPYYGSNYGSYGSYGRPGNGYYKPSYRPSYGCTSHIPGGCRPGYNGYGRPVYY